MTEKEIELTPTEVIEDGEVSKAVEVKRLPNTPNPPTRHSEGGLTQKQADWARAYMNTGNATQAAKEAYGEIKNPSQVGYAMKQKPQIMQYIMNNAHKCAQIQMQIIEDEGVSAAVRMDGIKDVLNRAGIGKGEEDDSTSIRIGDIKITIDK